MELLKEALMQRRWSAEVCPRDLTGPLDVHGKVVAT